ncbi:RNA-binding ribosome biosynthesis protein mak21 [Coemansia sp. Benny D115]|nr:RNA-binding ribosome biosynthesis protein mak21 [Coemansia sp. Benny D115]
MGSVIRVCSTHAEQPGNIGSNSKPKLKPKAKNGGTTGLKNKGGAANDDKALWEEIQKLGGDMADLNMLQEVDTGNPSSKPSKSAGKVNKESLKSELSDFAKSLGLSADIPAFAGIIDDEPKPQKSKKESKKESKKKNAETAPVKTKSSESADKKAPAAKDKKDGKKGSKQKKDAAVKEAVRAAETKGDSDDKDSNGDDEDDDVVDIPGFKIKSAKDSLPLSKMVGRLTIEPNPQWFSVKLPALTADEAAGRPSEAEVLQKAEFAEQLLQSENDLYVKTGANKKALSSSDRSFMSGILSAGTLSDKVAALTLIIQESPVHNLKSLEQLMGMVQKKNRREALMAVGSIKDLMSLNLLPSDRKLKHFADQPINAKGITNAHWIMWAFEDKLKRYYYDLIQVMESMSYDPVLHTRQNMIAYFEELLEQKPEQEQNLLRLLVNKLGDKERQLAAKASYLILKLLNAHPNMKYVVVKTIQELLLTKSSTKERAQYYTMITLNQIILSSKDVQTANLLLEVYFVLFKKLLKYTKELNDAEDAENEVNSDGETKSSAAAAAAEKKDKRRGAPRKVYIGQKALSKAKADAETKRAEEERSMDNKLLTAILTGLSRALPFSKMEDSVMEGHVSAIFQIAHAGNFNTVVQSLVLLFQIVRIRPSISDRFYRTLYDSLLDPRLESTSKKAMYLNVLFRALKTDTSMPRVMSFIKRIMQVCLYNQAEFTSGALFLISQILSVNPQLYTMLTQPEDNDDEERIVDADSDDDDASGKGKKTAAATGSKSRYDPLKRDPRYSGAETSCLWETVTLMHHFHPSVTHSLKQIFEGEQVAAINNLHNHSLSHFLDRFVFRKPKTEAKGDSDDDSDEEALGTAPAVKVSALRGQSIMQPLITQDGPETELGPNRTRIAVGDHFIASKRSGGRISGLDFTSDAIANLNKSDISPDEMFFHQFFTTKKARQGKKAKKGTKNEDEESGFAQDETGFANAVKATDGELDEDEIWDAMTASMPKVKGDAAGDDSMDDDDEDDEGLLAALGEDDSDLEGGSEEDEGSDDEDEDEDDVDGFPTFDDEISDSDDDEDDSDSGASDDSDVKPTAGSKRKDSAAKTDANEKPSKRKKPAKLPMFASFEDYAHMIDNDEGLE